MKKLHTEKPQYFSRLAQVHQQPLAQQLRAE
jgi:hypothetical protein